MFRQTLTPMPCLAFDAYPRFPTGLRLGKAPLDILAGIPESVVFVNCSQRVPEQSLLLPVPLSDTLAYPEFHNSIVDLTQSIVFCREQKRHRESHCSRLLNTLCLHDKKFKRSCKRATGLKIRFFVRFEGAGQRSTERATYEARSWRFTPSSSHLPKEGLEMMRY